VYLYSWRADCSRRCSQHTRQCLPEPTVNKTIVDIRLRPLPFLPGLCWISLSARCNMCRRLASHFEYTLFSRRPFLAIICKAANTTSPTKPDVHIKKGKGSPYSNTECRVPELIPVFGSQPAGDVNHKPDGRLPLLSARPAVTLATLKKAATNFAAW